MDTIQSVMKLLVSRLQKFAGVETILRGLRISSVAALALGTGFSLMMGVDGRFGMFSLVVMYELLS